MFLPNLKDVLSKLLVAEQPFPSRSRVCCNFRKSTLCNCFTRTKTLWFFPVLVTEKLRRFLPARLLLGSLFAFQRDPNASSQWWESGISSTAKRILCLFCRQNKYEFPEARTCGLEFIIWLGHKWMQIVITISCLSGNPFTTGKKRVGQTYLCWHDPGRLGLVVQICHRRIRIVRCRNQLLHRP